MVKTYRLNEFAALLGVSTKTLQRWDKSGKFKAYRTPTNQRFYTEEHLDKYKQLSGQVEVVEISRLNLCGIYSTSVVADGSMSDEMLYLNEDGTGAFAEANMGPYYPSYISWQYADGVLECKSVKDALVCGWISGAVVYKEHDHVEGMGDTVFEGPSLQVGDGMIFYKVTGPSLTDLLSSNSLWDN